MTVKINISLPQNVRLNYICLHISQNLVTDYCIDDNHIVLYLTTEVTNVASYYLVLQSPVIMIQ